MALFRHVKLPLRLCQAANVSVRFSSSKKDGKLPAYIEHATGLERKELLARAAGNDDPFGMNVAKRGPGTKDQPNLVPSLRVEELWAVYVKKIQLQLIGSGCIKMNPSDVIVDIGSN